MRAIGLWLLGASIALAQGVVVVPPITQDMPADSEPIQIVARGIVRNTHGEPLPNAAVELVMNPYVTTRASSRTWTATDAYGRYELYGTGHHGTARVQVAADGYRVDVRELGFIRRSRDLTFNFSLVASR